MIPNNKLECELNGGIWTTEIIGEQNPTPFASIPSTVTTPVPSEPQELVIPLDEGVDQEPVILG